LVQIKERDICNRADKSQLLKQKTIPSSLECHKLLLYPFSSSPKRKENYIKHSGRVINSWTKF